MKTKTLLFIIGIFFILSPVQSQVTIGSGIEPRKGSILELKENNEIGENSTKGFSLPRVYLTSPTELTVDNNTNKSKYKGLTVQNTNSFNGLTEGIYCWDGERWRLVVSVEKQGTDGQILTSKGDDLAPEWKSQTELSIPTVDLIANTIPTNSTIYLPSGFTNVKYDIVYAKDFEYDAANAYFTAKKTGYYQVYIYNKLHVNPPGGPVDNGGTASTNLAKRVWVSGNTYRYEGFLNLYAYYYKGSADIYHPISGLVYFEENQQYAVRTNYTREFRITGGRIAFTRLGD